MILPSSCCPLVFLWSKGHCKSSRFTVRIAEISKFRGARMKGWICRGWISRVQRSQNAYSQRALRDILMPRSKNWLPTVSRQFLTRNYPHPNCLLKCLPNCLFHAREGTFSPPKITPAERAIARQLRDSNCLAAIFVPRHQDVSSGPLGFEWFWDPLDGKSGQSPFSALWEMAAQCPPGEKFWGWKWLRQFYGRVEEVHSFCRKTAMPIKFLVLGGGICVKKGCNGETFEGFGSKMAHSFYLYWCLQKVVFYWDFLHKQGFQVRTARNPRADQNGQNLHGFQVRTPICHIVPVSRAYGYRGCILGFGGGGKCRFYFYGREDFSEQLRVAASITFLFRAVESPRLESEKKRPKKSNTKICFLPPYPPFKILCVCVFPTFQSEKQPENKNFRGWRPLKEGGFRHGILGEIFVFGCLFRPS